MITAVTLVVALFYHPAPGPLDAFRANLAACKVECSYEFTQGFVNIDGLRAWPLRDQVDIPFVAMPEREVRGSWSFDGMTEHAIFSSPDSVIAAGRAQPKGTRPGKAERKYVPRTELIRGEDHIAAFISDDDYFSVPGVIQVWDKKEIGLVTSARGPFSWWAEYPFPEYLELKMGDAEVSRKQTAVNGRISDLEIYIKKYPNNAEVRVEVAYAPELGYLPRYMRKVTLVPEKKVLVKEMYLIRSHLCGSGGFVPAEWYETSYDAAAIEHSSYTEQTPLRPIGRLGVGHFRTSRISDLKTPIVFRTTDRAKVVSYKGQSAKLTTKANLSLPVLKRTLGRRLTQPQVRALPTLDSIELRKFERRSSWRYAAWAVAALPMLILVVLWVRSRRRPSRVSAVILASMLLFAGTGCSRSTTYRLTGEIDPSEVFLAPFERSTVLHLRLRNQGEEKLVLTGVDGGCTCRQVTHSRFPQVLDAGRSVSIPFDYTHGGVTQTHHMAFTIKTDRSQLLLPVDFTTIAPDQLSPETPTHMALSEEESWSFELTHRHIAYANESPQAFELMVPNDFQVSKTSEDTSVIASAPGLEYRDTIYRLTLHDKRIGLFKDTLSIRRVGDPTPLASSTIIWKRVPELSSVPERVSLGEKPTRAFLRCSDSSIEIVKVVSTPKGVSAIVASPREIIVKLESGAPSIVEGPIVVETNFRNRQQLRIPVVRYSGAP
ncbi:MAG: hypothetical protein SFX72_13790 [Isosphaeraceae bacterium]|nr:hypothetical protein [Isosphaeraceae bacterium]